MDGMPQGQQRGEMLASISTALVQLHSRYYGKGTTQETFIVDGTVPFRSVVEQATGRKVIA